MALSDLLREHATPLALGGNKPLKLEDSGNAWLMESGFADVFFIPASEGDLPGRRVHLFRVEPGEILMGLDPGEGLGGLIAVAGPGSEALQVPSRELLDRLSDADEGPGLLDSWVRRMSSPLHKRLMVPKSPSFLEPGGEASGDAAAEFSTQTGEIWVKVCQGELAFLGKSEWPLLQAGTVFPVSETTWIEAMGEVHLTSLSTSELLRDPAASDWLDRYHGYILACLRVLEQEHRKQDEEHLGRKMEADRTVLQNVLLSLGLVLDHGKAKVSFRVDPEHPLLAACQMVGESAGIRVQTSVHAKKGDEGVGEDLRDISRISRFRTRETILKGRWWTQDNGPLLGAMEEDGRPVALIPSSTKSYELFDPISGDVTQVNAKVAEGLSPQAHMFYRPFPDKKISGLDLLKLGFRGCRRDLATVLIMGLAGSLLGLLLPTMTGLFFDTFIPEAAREELVQMSIILAACAFATAMFEITKGIALVRIEGRMDSSIQAALWDRLLGLPVPFFRDFTAGDLAKRSIGINQIRTILSGMVVNSLLGFLFSILYLLLLFTYDAKLALVGVAIVTLGLGCVLAISYFQIRFQRLIIKSEGENAGFILQLMTGVAKLRVSGTEDRGFAVWARRFAEQRVLSTRSGITQNFLEVFNSTFPVVSTMVIFVWIVFMTPAASVPLSTGKFIAFMAAFSIFQTGMLQMAMVLVASLNVLPLYERLRPILQEMPESDASKAPAKELTGAIEVSHVNFRYVREGSLILNDVSFSVRPGEFVALVGPSGSGKSTLLRMMLGFETPESGSVYYDGQDLGTTDVREIRQQMGVVLQNGTVMQGSVFQNIVGASGLTIDDAWEAARMVGFDQDISDMPMGMHTMLVAGAGTLSGGQRQRLIIARAIVRKPRILFFDEATSALDNHTQAVVSRSLEGLNVTRIVIAHRLSTIVNADRIYVMDKGQIVEHGSYEGLLARNGLFSELARRQIA